MLAEWFGQVWESATPTGSGRWSEVGSPSHRRGTAFVQTALFSGTASGFPGREEVIVAGLGTNNEWVFRADDRLGWLLRKATNEAVFSGLIEFMHDAEGVPMPLIPFKRFPADPEAVPPSDIRDYAMMRGPRIHKAIADSQRVDPSNSMLVKDASGRWQRRRLPMELQVAPILDAAVIPTSGGPHPRARPVDGGSSVPDLRARRSVTDPLNGACPEACRRPLEQSARPRARWDRGVPRSAPRPCHRSRAIHG